MQMTKLFRYLQNIIVSIRYLQYSATSVEKLPHQGQILSSEDPLTHRVEQLSDSHRQNEPLGQPLLHRGAPGCPAESSTGPHQYHSLQCSPVHGFGRLRNYPPKQNRRRISRGNQETNKKRTNSKVLTFQNQ